MKWTICSTYEGWSERRGVIKDRDTKAQKWKNKQEKGKFLSGMYNARLAGMAAHSDVPINKLRPHEFQALWNTKGYAAMMQFVAAQQKKEAQGT